jgi:orotidine-5'-phosphate decarboxylase
VVRSSNPEGRGLQESVDRQGLSVEDALMAELARANAAERAAGRRLGSLGAVVGVTQGPWRLPLGEFGGPILAPGVGAQGATPADVGAVFGACAAGSVVVNASRSLLEAGPRPPALRAAAEALREELAAALA